MYKKILLVSALALGLSSTVFAVAKTKDASAVAPATPKTKDVSTVAPATPKTKDVSTVAPATAKTNDASVVAPAATTTADVADTADYASEAPVVDVAGIGESYYNSSIYFGGQGLITNMHYGNSAYTLSRNSVSTTKGGGRGYLGYAFNQFLALETGYNYFGSPKLEDKITGNTQEFLQQGVDFTAKATLPLDYGFGVFIKVGGLWVWRSGVGSRSGCFVDKDPNNKITAFAGLGISYNFVPSTGIDFSYARSFSVGDLPKMDIFALGLSYKINM